MLIRKEGCAALLPSAHAHISPLSTRLLVFINELHLVVNFAIWELFRHLPRHLEKGQCCEVDTEQNISQAGMVSAAAAAVGALIYSKIY